MAQRNEAEMFFSRNKMTIYIPVFVILLATVYTLENIDRNVVCDEIKTRDGFKFPFECPAGNEIDVYRNQKKIDSPETMSIIDNFVVTKECTDIQIRCSHDGKPAWESQLSYRTVKKRFKRWRPTTVEKDISCHDIKTQDGYEYPLECPDAKDITVYRNKTTIAIIGPDNQTQHLAEVKSIDKHSITMSNCIDIGIHCFTGDIVVNESRLNYKAVTIDHADKIKDNDTSFPARKACVIASSVVCIILVAGLLLVYLPWKKKITREQQGAATLSAFIKYLSGRFRCKETGSSDIERGARETEAEVVIAMNDIQPQSDGPSEVELPDTGNSEPDGLTPHDHLLALSDEGIQKGHHTASEGASHDRAMNRNLRGEPGGVNEDDERIKEINSECLPCDCGSATQEKEEQPLLSAQRGSDVTGETAALLKNGSTDQDLDGGS